MNSYTRHIGLVSRDDSALLVIDMQERLIPHMAESDGIVTNVERLVAASQRLGVPKIATEQYPQGLGPTIASLQEHLPDCHTKMTFSAATIEPLINQWRDSGLFKVVVCGIESHVCVLQTTLDLLGAGFQVFVVVDAVSSRCLTNKEIAIKRMESSGAALVSTEMVILEWLERADAAEFKSIQKLIK